MKRTLALLLGLLLCGALAPAQATVKLATLFQDDMVLQQGMEVPVWGTAAPGEQVTVTIAGKQATAVADVNGQWMARLPALEAGMPFTMVATGSDNSDTCENVAVGEVWVASGQSNMQMPVSGVMNAQREIRAARYPGIREFGMPRTVSVTPRRECKGYWEPCNPKNVVNYSAVGYFFARQLHRDLGVPVGIIHTSWGGTPVESWISRPVLEAEPTFRYLTANWDAAMQNYAKAVLDNAKQMSAWQAAAEQALAAGQPLPMPPTPTVPDDPRNNPWLASGLYNAMIQPVVGYAIRGVIWYQGESNAGRAYEYRTLFPAMIENWRQAWGQGDFPFLFVQLANFMDTKPEPGESAWAELREAQLMALRLPNTGMATIIDIGDAKDIHPKNKQEVGRRLALWAEATTYGKRQEYSGPLYRSMEVEGDAIRLHFDHTGGGLKAKGKALTGFAIAGEDRRFVWAQARIEGDTVIVRSSQVAKPVAVRYGWADNPVCNLYNGAGLPASPFRTDDWPGITAPKG